MDTDFVTHAEARLRAGFYDRERGGRQVHPVDWSEMTEVLSSEECYRLLARTAVGRLGYVTRHGPVILPVNFVVNGVDIAFRTGSGEKLASAGAHAPVCFEADEFDTGHETGWSVVVEGQAEEIIDPAEIASLMRLGLRPWPTSVKPHWIRVRTGTISGRRILHPAVFLG